MEKTNVSNLLRKTFRRGPRIRFGGCQVIRTLNVSIGDLRLRRSAANHIRVTPNGREHESRTHSSCYGVGALAVRWLTVCLALGEVWREVEESNSTGSVPVHGFQDRSATNHRHLPHVKELWWPRRDSNSYARRHWFLRPAWFPITPLGHGALNASRTHQISFAG